MSFGNNSKTGRPGPCPALPKDNDKKQARHRINVEVRTGYRLHPNLLPCVDCGHIWKNGERRHEYDHYLGYSAEHHYDVQSVCTLCHAQRDNEKAKKTHCKNGHDFNLENTIYPVEGGRACRQCRRDFDRKRVRPEGYWKSINERRRARAKQQD